MESPDLVSPTKQISRLSALRQRNRRRAKDLSAEKIRAIKVEFQIQRSTEEVGRNNSIPRFEAVDAVMLETLLEVRHLREQIAEFRDMIHRQMYPGLRRAA